VSPELPSEHKQWSGDTEEHPYPISAAFADDVCGQPDEGKQRQYVMD
jgi:hypothetical protein